MFVEERTELQFDWSHLGDIALGRPNLGAQTSVAVYRLMQFTLRDAAIKIVGVEKATQIFHEAGYSSGKALYENLLEKPESIDELISRLQTILKDLRIGILRVEEIDTDQKRVVVTVAEDLDCSGLPMNDESICTWDEGFIAGILESFNGHQYKVKEIDCWCTGDRVCRFEAVAQ